MSLDFALYSMYTLGALWLGPSGAPACLAGSPTVRDVRTAYALAGAPRPSTLAAVTAFIDVNVVPMDTERVLAKHTVLVEGNRIIALGPSGQVKVPRGAVRIDGHGKYLIPGLANMHEHAGM